MLHERPGVSGLTVAVSAHEEHVVDHGADWRADQWNLRGMVVAILVSDRHLRLQPPDIQDLLPCLSLHM